MVTIELHLLDIIRPSIAIAMRAAKPPPDNLTDAYAQSKELEGNVIGIAEMRIIALMMLMSLS